MRNDDNFIGLIIGIALFLPIVIFGIKNCGEYEKKCHAKGGHTMSLYKSTICVSNDGRIIEVQ